MQARKVFAGVAVALAVVAHGLLGLFILFSLVGVHPAIVGAGLMGWGLGIYLMSRWRRRPDRVTFIPIVVAVIYVLAIVIGAQFGLVGA